MRLTTIDVPKQPGFQLSAQISSYVGSQLITLTGMAHDAWTNAELARQHKEIVRSAHQRLNRELQDSGFKCVRQATREALQAEAQVLRTDLAEFWPPGITFGGERMGLVVAAEFMMPVQDKVVTAHRCDLLPSQGYSGTVFIYLDPRDGWTTNFWIRVNRKLRAV